MNRFNKTMQIAALTAVAAVGAVAAAPQAQAASAPVGDSALSQARRSVTR